MKQDEQIKEQLTAFAAKYGPAALVTATVTAVNEDDTVALLFADGSTVDDARLKAVVKDGDKIILTPAVNSKVLVGKIENSDECVVVSVDEITKIKVKVGNVEYNLDNTGFLFSKGTDTLKKILTNIVEATQQIVVIYGNNPDYTKLAEAQTSIENLLQ